MSSCSRPLVFASIGLPKRLRQCRSSRPPRSPRKSAPPELTAPAFRTPLAGISARSIDYVPRCVASAQLSNVSSRPMAEARAGAGTAAYGVLRPFPGARRPESGSLPARVSYRSKSRRRGRKTWWLLMTQSGRDLFDHLIGTDEQRLRHRHAERSCSLQVDDELELGRLLYW